MEMIDYIAEQPKVFRAALEARAQVAKPFVDLFLQTQPDRLYIVASGTSCNGAATAAPFMEQVLDMDVIACPPSRITHLRGKKPLVIYVSQGGNSTNTIAAMQRFAGVPSIALTGDPGRICDICDNYLRIPCGPETAGPKTKGYTMTILTLYLMALQAGLFSGRLPQAQYDTYIAVLEQAADLFAANVQCAIDWQTRNDESLRGMRTAYLVGKGQCLAVSQEGGLKLQETMLIPTASFEFEEFLHGPTSSIGEQIAGFYLLPPEGDADRQRMEQLIAHHRTISSRVYTVGGGSDSRDCAVACTGQWYTQPFELILPMQTASAVVPAELAIGDASTQTFHKLDMLLGIKFKGPDGETEYTQA